jgi:hypothetical protein
MSLSCLLEDAAARRRFDSIQFRGMHVPGLDETVCIRTSKLGEQLHRFDVGAVSGQAIPHLAGLTLEALPRQPEK